MGAPTREHVRRALDAFEVPDPIDARTGLRAALDRLAVAAMPGGQTDLVQMRACGEAPIVRQALDRLWRWEIRCCCASVFSDDLLEAIEEWNDTAAGFES